MYSAGSDMQWFCCRGAFSVTLFIFQFIFSNVFVFPRGMLLCVLMHACVVLSNGYVCVCVCVFARVLFLIMHVLDSNPIVPFLMTVNSSMNSR